MTFSQYVKSPSSKKITIVEIDSPIDYYKWINFDSGIFFMRLTPGNSDFEDDNGNTAYWDTRNSLYYNIQSLNIDGSLYGEASSLAICESTEQSWFYDTDTTDLYIHFESNNPPLAYGRIAPGAAIGFTDKIDNTVNNYFEDIYYQPLITSVPNLSKSKDPLFFGIIEYQEGSITFDNTAGDFDQFAQNDLYNQPVRIKLSFEGLPYSEAVTVYSAKVDDFQHSFDSFTVNVQDVRKTLSRELPVNTLSLTDYPDMDSKLDGTPVPIAFGQVIKARAYKVTDTGATETFVFCDTEFNAIDSGITVYDKDGVEVTTAGTETDGTFTTTSTEDKLYVTFSVSAVTNGLDIITDVLGNYESVDFNYLTFDTEEWTTEKANVRDSGIWIGKGSLMTSAEVIEQICIDNNGIFDVLADGRFTFRTYNPDRIPSHEIYEDELLEYPSVEYDSDEYLTSVKVEYSEDLLEKESELYTNTDLEEEVYGRYRQYKESTIKTKLTNEADSITLSSDIMEQSSFIYPSVTLKSEMSNVGMRILDNVLYHYKRLSGSSIIDRSKYQALSVELDLSNYEINATIEQIEEDNNSYYTIDGGRSNTDYNYYDGGTASASGETIIDGGGA